MNSTTKEKKIRAIFSIHGKIKTKHFSIPADISGETAVKLYIRKQIVERWNGWPNWIELDRNQINYTI